MFFARVSTASDPSLLNWLSWYWDVVLLSALFLGGITWWISRQEGGRRGIIALYSILAYTGLTYYVCTETDKILLQLALVVVGAAAWLVIMFFAGIREGWLGGAATGIQMAMKKCPNCMGKLSSKWGTTCPHCNSKLPSF